MVAFLAVAVLPKTLTVKDDCVSAVFRGGHPLNFSPILILWAVSSCSMWMIMALPLHWAGLTLSNIFAPSSALHMSFFVNSPWPVCLPSFLCCCVSYFVFFTYKSNFSTGSLSCKRFSDEKQLSSVFLAELGPSRNKLQSCLTLFPYCKTVPTPLLILWWPHWTELAWSPDFSVAWRPLWLYFLPAYPSCKPTRLVFLSLCTVPIVSCWLGTASASTSPGKLLHSWSSCSLVNSFHVRLHLIATPSSMLDPFGLAVLPPSIYSPMTLIRSSVAHCTDPLDTRHRAVRSLPLRASLRTPYSTHAHFPVPIWRVRLLLKPFFFPLSVCAC